jgi:hypothetical protein
MALFYWAVRPKSARDYGPAIRIEKAGTVREALRLAFGGPIISPQNYEAKNLGTRIAVIHSDRKRVALLKDPKGWETIR